jgi:hypothetical protein
MNDLYGVDPAAPASMLEFVSLMRFFGPGEGRFIADFPGQWIHDVSQHIKSFSQLEQMAALELWVRYGRYALLPTGARYNPKWSWSENATNLSEHVVKLIGTKGCPATLVPIDRALLDPGVFPDARGGHFPRTAHSYATVARPLLQTSTKIVLVDPYLKFRTTIEGTNSYRQVSRFRETLDALFREAVKWKRVECFKFAVSTKEAFHGDPGGKDFKSEMRKLADKNGAHDMKLDFCELDDHSSTHARYLLGMHSGLHFDRGLDTGDPTSKNHIDWIGPAALQPLLVQFT